MARNVNAPPTTHIGNNGNKRGASMSDDKDTAREIKAAAAIVDQVNRPAVTQYVRLDEINVDEARNPRQDYGPDEGQGSIAWLADDIAENNQRQPMLVERNPKGGYDLIGGFRRMRALRLIETQTRAGKREGVDPVLAWVSVQTPESPAEAAYLAWDDNLARKDLTPYENARTAATMVEKYGQKAGDIAKKVKLDRKYVDNLIRAYTQVEPRIREFWGKGHPRATWTFVLSVSAQSHAEQWQAWREHIGEIDAEGNPVANVTAPVTNPGNGGGGGAKDPGRASMNNLLAAIRYVKDSDKSKDWKSGALAALSFAAGQQPRIPAVYDPEKAKVAEAAERKAEKDAEREAAKAAAKAAADKVKGGGKGRPTASA